MTDSFTYDAGGILIERTGSTPNNYLYAGEQFDHDLNLYYNRARYLDVNRGRFWSQDSFEGNKADPISLHKYLYAGADPINKIDPSGEIFIADTLAIGTILASLPTFGLRSSAILQDIGIAKIIYEVLLDDYVVGVLLQLGVKGLGKAGTSGRYNWLQRVYSNTAFTKKDGTTTPENQFYDDAHPDNPPFYESKKTLKSEGGYDLIFSDGPGRNVNRKPVITWIAKLYLVEIQPDGQSRVITSITWGWEARGKYVRKCPLTIGGTIVDPGEKLVTTFAKPAEDFGCEKMKEKLNEQP